MKYTEEEIKKVIDLTESNSFGEIQSAYKQMQKKIESNVYLKEGDPKEEAGKMTAIEDWFEEINNHSWHPKNKELAGDILVKIRAIIDSKADITRFDMLIQLTINKANLLEKEMELREQNLLDKEQNLLSDINKREQILIDMQEEIKAQIPEAKNKLIEVRELWLKQTEELTDIMERISQIKATIKPVNPTAKKDPENENKEEPKLL